MIVEIDNFRAICHGNKIEYSSHPSMHFTPKAGQAMHNRKVPILMNHEHANTNACIGYAILKWCSDTCEIYADCYLNDNAKKQISQKKKYALDVWMNCIKHTHAGNICNFIIREVSLIDSNSIPEHEEIIFKFLKGTKIRPNAEIKWDFGTDGRDSGYYIEYTCPNCKKRIFQSDYKCKGCNMPIDWSKKAYIEYTRHIEWR